MRNSCLALSSPTAAGEGKPDGNTLLEVRKSYKILTHVKHVVATNSQVPATISKVNLYDRVNLNFMSKNSYCQKRCRFGLVWLVMRVDCICS